MKNLILLLALSAISNSIVISQGCLPDGITFTTQEQIDNFQANYPGCTEIEGDVIIGDTFFSYSITNLEGLSALNSIGGDLIVQFNHSLNNLMGLNNITSIGGNLEFKFNPILTNLAGLLNLTYIEGRLYLLSNYTLSNLNGLINLTNIGGDLNIYDNDELLSISALNNLNNVGGSIKIELNSSLVNLSGLESLTSAEEINIAINSTLISFDGLNNIITIDSSLSIWDNDNITNLEGLNNLTSIGGNLKICYNENLLNTNSLGNLTSIGGDLKIIENQHLFNIFGLVNINSNTILNLSIVKNPSLSDCDIQNICEYLLNPNGTVSIHDNAPGCNSPEEVETACLTSIEDNIAKEGITIFPNPATSYITIDIKEGIPIEEAIIYNHLGQKALVAEPVNNTVDVSGLTPGIYFLEVITSESRAGTKLVVE